jgi:hypothetical protein
VLLPDPARHFTGQPVLLPDPARYVTGQGVRREKMVNQIQQDANAARFYAVAGRAVSKATPHCIIATTLEILRCTALHAMQCNAVTMQRRSRCKRAVQGVGSLRSEYTSVHVASVMWSAT